LAERIRSAIFFAASGVEASPIQVLPFMGIAHDPGDWMVKTFQEIWNRLPQMREWQGVSCEILVNFVRKSWILDQTNYHEGKSKELEKKNHCLEKSGIIIFVLAVTAAFFHIVLFFPGHEVDAGWLESGLTFAAIVLPAIGAVFGGIRTHREYSRLAKRSTNMVAILKGLDEHFSRITKPEVLESSLRDMEELMLRETQDWLMLMRFVKLEAVP
jgi:hypothetical protein